MSTIRITSTLALLAAALLSAGPAPSSERVRPAGREVVLTGTPGDPAGRYAARFEVRPPLARLILDAAREAGMDPDVVFGLIAVESRFDPHAVGRQGERGLMQVKPSTAAAYERGITPERLARPETNLRIGLAHLKAETDHFGSLSLGLVAYNMGRGRLSRLLEAGHRPTRAYASRVLDGRPEASS